MSSERKLIAVPEEEFVQFILNGDFRGECIGVEPGTEQPTGIPYRPLFRIVADENTVGTDDNGVEQNAAHMHDKVVKGETYWLNKNPDKDQAWKNKYYRDGIEKLGMEWPVVEGVKNVHEIVDEDVFGHTFDITIKAVPKKNSDRVYHEVSRFKLDPEVPRKDYKEYLLEQMAGEEVVEEAAGTADEVSDKTQSVDDKF